MLRLLFRLLALCLALFWVPVTAHCQMEALGVEFGGCAEPCHEPTPGHAADACGLVESGLYKATVDAIKVPPASTLLCLALVLPPTLDEISDAGLNSPPGQAERPRDWVPTRHFVQRAALSPRAPSLSLA